MRKWHFIPLVLFLAAGAGWWYVQGDIPGLGQLSALSSQAQAMWRQLVGRLETPLASSGPPGLSASGFIEARQVSMMSEVSGRIVAIAVEEGDQVRRGDLLIALDDELLEAQLAEAEAEVELSEASLARTKVGLPPEEIRRLEALVRKAEVARDWAWVAWQDALAIRQHPQELEVELVEARARAQAMDHQLKQALALKDAAEISKDELARTVTWLRGGFDVKVPVPGGGTVTKHIKVSEGKIEEAQDELNAAITQWWQAWVGVNTAASSKEGAQAALSELLAIWEAPQDLQAQVNVAWTQYEQAREAVKVARAQLALAKAGASAEEVAVAEARVAQARAAYDALAVQRDKYRLRAPIAGRVVELLVEEGETISPGSPLLTLADLDEVTLTVYIPEADIGKVKIGQPVVVTVDSYPGREFRGEVTYIATESEFTPRNVQTQEERVNIVFAVKVELPNPDGTLKPDMPADAVLES